MDPGSGGFPIMFLLSNWMGRKRTSRLRTGLGERGSVEAMLASCDPPRPVHLCRLLKAPHPLTLLRTQQLHRPLHRL
jgi:hypothetical protein